MMIWTNRGEVTLTKITSRLNEEEKRLARLFGKYYLQKNNGNYEQTATEIEKLGISEFTLLPEGKLKIVSSRVGLLIGRRGLNIDNLARFLEVEVSIYKDPDPLISYLVPYEYSDDYDLEG